jgi:hypothetical protein
MKVLVWSSAVLGIVSVVLGILGVLALEPWHPRRCWECVLPWVYHHHCAPERSSSALLKTLAAAQAHYRANDQDGNGKEDFWRGDVAGLYLTVPPGSNEMIKLVEISVASADSAPSLDITRIGPKAPRAGYWFKAIRHADEEPGKLNPDRFAFCAYPVDPVVGKDMYILDENNTIFRAPAVKGGIDVYPDEKVLRENWSKWD